MKSLLVLAAAWLLAMSLAQAQPGHPTITKPDLVGNIQHSGNNLVVTVANETLPNPHNSSGKAARSTAKLTINGQSQTIQVPEIAPGSKSTHQISIPATLRNQLIETVLVVDQARVIVEMDENNNTFKGNFNAPDLTPVLVNGSVKFREDATSYYISVKNASRFKSARFAVSVTYQLRNGQTKVVQGTAAELPAGGTIEVKVPAPPADCFNQDCRFKVELDPANSVKELLETNNTANGVRIG
jgi:subtilase family serine protease